MLSAKRIYLGCLRKSHHIEDLPFSTDLLMLCRGLDGLALILVWLFVPGTERQISTMEEMNYVFGVTTRRHMDYQLNQVAPWCYRHYVRRRRVEDVPPLYRYERARNTTNGL